MMSKEAREAMFAAREVRTANIRLYVTPSQYERLTALAKARKQSRLKTFEIAVETGIAALARRGANA